MIPLHQSDLGGLGRGLRGRFLQRPMDRTSDQEARTPTTHGPLLQALVVADLLSPISPAALLPALVGLSAIGAWPWHTSSLQIAAGALTLATILVDGISLSLLPRFGRSYGPPPPPLFALALLRTGITFALGAIYPTWTGFALCTLLQVGLVATQAYATWIEPARLTITHQRLTSPKLRGDATLRLLHISDIHFEGWTPREKRLLETVKDLHPDLVLLTGDYLNLSSADDPEARQEVRDLLAQIAAQAPTYAVTGSPPVDLAHIVPSIFDGLPITWLMDRAVEVHINGLHLRLIGLRCTRDRHADGARLRRLLPDDTGDLFTVLLYHSPDLMPDAVACGIDLYLAGHTHGGQLRLPLFGALVTSSDFGKRYEMGLYREGNTALYVSRGLGMEGLGAPRARFLAPPEIIVWDLEADRSRVHNGR